MADPPANPAHHPLTRAVARSLRRRCGVGDGAEAGGSTSGGTVSGGAASGGAASGGLLVAVSGGADSVALVRALAALAPRRRWRLTLTVAHVQHHLRGKAAEADAQFVESLAQQLGLASVRRDLDPSTQTKAAGNVEAWARRARYAALAEMARDVGATHIATAHHGDDQLETLLMRLLRGTGVTGLRGIAWRRRLKPPPETGETPVTIIRPMLGVARADVMDYLHAIAQSWCEDHTNADVSRDRARLRHDVLPILHGMRGDAPRRATRLADHARDAHRLVRHEARRAYEQLVQQTSAGYTLDRTEARQWPRVVITALLRRVLRDAGVPRDRLKRRTVTPIVRAVRDRAGGERRFELAGNVAVAVTRESVWIGRS